MERTESVSRFNRLYFGDSLLRELRIETGEALCRLIFSACKVLRSDDGSIFDPEVEFAPALLVLRGVRSVTCEGPRYQLNSTVVDFGAELIENGEYLEFYFDLTGGHDPDAFMIRLSFVAKEFELGPATG